MKLKSFLAILALVAIASLASPVTAETVKLQSKDKVEGACNESGGVYFPPSSTSSTYGCLNSDGHGIVCGGSGKDATTCDTFIKVPPQLPSRAQLRKFQVREAAAQNATTTKVK